MGWLMGCIMCIALAIAGVIQGLKGAGEQNKLIAVIMIIIALLLLKRFVDGKTGKVERKKLEKTEKNEVLTRQYKNPYVDVSLYDNGNIFPEVKYSHIFLQQGEWLVYAVPASMFLEKEQVVGYSGGSVGVSFRVAKGISLRTGSSKGKPIRGNVTKFNKGDYVITNKRILFVSQNGGFEFDVKKISATKIVGKDAFLIVQGNKQKNICMDPSQTKYALGMTNFAIGEAKK